MRRLSYVRVWAASMVALGIGALSVAADSVDELLARAAAEYSAGRYQAALEALEDRPAARRDARVFDWRARVHYELGNYKAAIAAAERAVELQPNDSEVRRNLARCYGRYAQARNSFTFARRAKAEFEAAIVADPANIRARRDLMQYLVRAPFLIGGSKSRAREQAEAIARLDPVEGHLAWAYYHQRVGEDDEATARYRRVVEAGARTVDAYFEMADFGASRGLEPIVETALDEACEIDPEDPRVSFYRGAWSALSGRDLETGRSALESYLMVPPHSDRPSHAEAHEWLGDVLRRQGGDRQAAEHYRKAVELDPKAESAREKLRELG